ncbi:MAG: recombinase family protein [Clostridia bacterium]|nr:recombinase family protein [Clostridia bacterium]
MERIKNQAALYLRLSRDDEKSAESESIVNQRDFLLAYAKKHNFTVVAILADDGYSGTSFHRPDFLKLLAMIERKEVNVVITKDLSRLGRDYIQTGYYIEQYFPLHRVRYIAVNDGIDTEAGGVGNDLSPFRAVFNDMYARDISLKVRTALQTKKLNGRFIGSKAPYGYKKSAFDKNKLVPVESQALIVQEIYRRYNRGESMNMIAQALTEKGVETPSLSSKNNKWNTTTIRRILSSPTYAGHLTQNKSRKINYKLNQKITLPKETWITVEGTHEAIISQREFETAAKRLGNRHYNNRNRGKENHLLSGVVYCADCGSKMSFMYSGNHCYIVCSKWRKGQGRCTSHCIREEFVEKYVMKKLNQICYIENSSIINPYFHEIKQICIDKNKEIFISFKPKKM